MRKTLKHRRFRVLLICVAIASLFALFQNMSPYDETDIRELAPKDIDESRHPKNTLLPDRLKGRSPESIGKEILLHNLAEPIGEVERLGEQIENWASWELTGSDNRGVPLEGSSASTYPTSGKSMKVKAGLVGSKGLGFIFETNFKLKCEFTSRNQEIQLSVNNLLNTKANVSMQHNTDKRESSVNFSYQW